MNLGFRIQMSHKEISQLDEMIVQEKRSIARAQICELWENAVEEGIDVEIVAEEFISGALIELSRANGPEKVKKFIDEISKRDSCGDFLPGKILQ